MSYKKDNRMDKLQMRLKEVEEENRVLKQEQNQLISTLLKQLSELQMNINNFIINICRILFQHKYLSEYQQQLKYSKIRRKDEIRLYKNKIVKSYQTIRIKELYYMNLTNYVEPIRLIQIYCFWMLIIKFKIINNNQHYQKELVKKQGILIRSIQQNKLKEKTVKSVSSQKFINNSKKQSMESLDSNIKLESQLLDEEQSLLELLEIPQVNKLCLKIDQLGQQIIEKLRDFSQKRDSRHRLVEQLIKLN